MTAVEALERHLAKYRKACVRTAFHILHNADDAEDAVQDACLRVVATKSPFAGDSQFGTWFHRVLLNACYSILRHRKGVSQNGPRQFLELPLQLKSSEPFLYSKEPSCHDALVARQAVERAHRRAEQFPKQLRMIFRTYFVGEMTLSEIAAATNLKHRSVKSLRHRCIQAFRAS